ncbi:CapA family protein [Haloechinothrix sp. LS1_15]|uniref:CapA family protein n=1 Tax=Haloechinothrix sp. LS1_15 TaxID=2652248 RepID=UPI00294AE70D|nr:CapA family protein [Haloechinothrix sp. LS1_15]
MASYTAVFVGDVAFGEQAGTRQNIDILTPLLDGADLLVANLEGVLAASPTRPAGQPDRHGLWNEPESTISQLRQLGVDAVNLANDHAMDYGPDPLAATATRLSEAGIAHFGAGPDAGTAAAPLTRRIALDSTERNLHVLGALEPTAEPGDGVGTFATAGRWGVHPLSARGAAARIGALRNEDPDAFTVLYPHWGRAYGWSTETAHRTADQALSAGADLVIGHGPHMLQEVSGDGHRAVIFSAGALLPHPAAKPPPRRAPPYSLVTRVTWHVRPSGWGVDRRLYPVIVEDTATGRRPRPVTGTEAEHVLRLLAGRSADPVAFAGDHLVRRDAHGWHIRRADPDNAHLVRLPSRSGAGPSRSGRFLRPVRQRLRSPATTAGAGGGANRPAPATPPRLSKDFGPGSTHECIAEALATRDIPYTHGTARVAGKTRPVMWFRINDQPYISSGARIYLAREDGTARRSINRGATRVVGRKDLMASILRAQGLSVPEGMTFRPDQRREALLYFDSLRATFEHGFCVKPVVGKLGRDVHTGLRTREEFGEAFDAVAATSSAVLAQEGLTGDVFRFTCVDGEISAVGVGVPMNVLGDGTSSISELVEEKNRARDSNPMHRLYPAKLGTEQLNHLAAGGWNPEAVPAAGQTVYLASTSNLHRGADFVDRTDDVHPTYREIVTRAVAAVDGVRVCGVDVFISDHGEPARHGNHGILEINVGNGVSGHHYPWCGKPRDTAGDIVDMLLRTEAP